MTNASGPADFDGQVDGHVDGNGPGTDAPAPTWAARLRARFGGRQRRQRRHGADGRSGKSGRSGGHGGTPQRTAFVLAGGGSRGAVQVGMLDELVRRGIRADRVFGASVGAINGAAYAGNPTPEGIEHMADVWRGVTGGDIFPRGALDGPWAYFQKRPSVHANSGLRKIIEAGVNYENLEDASVPIEVVTTSLTDGRERWITRGPAAEAILASSAIPSIFPPVTIDGDVLIDGGVVNNVPISRALTAGCDRIYVLLCGPLHYHPKPPRRPAEAVLTAFFVAIHARFVRELASLPHGVEVIVFSGGGDPSGQYRDFSSTSALIEEGRTEVADVLDRYVGTSHDLGVAAVGGPPTPAAEPGTAGGPGPGSVPSAEATAPTTEPAGSP
ncbi:MAG TPA: patatin-like phospholipase family protein [Acidimicrobiales bacterium]|nr:patatin-like phospholipase family protein [Acidimicrobiales bacterium]